MNLRESTIKAIDEVTEFLRSSPWKDRYLGSVEQLRREINEPCVLAVAGRVKAGKSTLVNALLGQDLSLTGVTETTATINYFRYGTPEDPTKPVRCVWRNGRRTWETKKFLDGLQGTSEEALARAEGISHLEFYLPHPELRDVTLVDTPGTDAIAGEDENVHERRTDAFFGTGETAENADAAERKSALQKRHSEDTREISGAADAVIYLVGQVAHVTNQAFLQEFQDASMGQTKALNAIGVMSKIDMFDEVLEKRHELASAIAKKLTAELNTVVPVSAGLWRAVSRLKVDEDAAKEFKATLVGIPEERFVRMLASDRAFLRDYPDCPVSADARRKMMADLPWRVFVVVAREFRAKTVEEAITALEDLSGFADLRRMCQSHFFKRAQLLRCFRILSDLYTMLGEIRRSAVYDHKMAIRQTQKDLIEFTDFIIEHPKGKSDTANRLRHFLTTHMPKDDAAELETIVEQLVGQVERLRTELEHVNSQFQGLQLLEDAPSDVFSQEELTELRGVFGLYAREGDGQLPQDKAGQRQIYWRQAQFVSRSPVRKQVAILAQHFYGLMLQPRHL